MSDWSCFKIRMRPLDFAFAEDRVVSGVLSRWLALVGVGWRWLALVGVGRELRWIVSCEGS
ncbi:hypothetical protein [Neorhodopirellula lusitana]|uniref:hypothetical protein n=1 Tax=Neorhodopirellula lusitana TaxID=445327 RepID=UPI00384F92B8